MSFYPKKSTGNRGRHMCLLFERGNVRVSSKADAIFDGIGSLLDVFPCPRARTIRTFVYHGYKRPDSVDDAISEDWTMIGQDMWAAIRAHEHEESTESSEENIAGSKSLTAR